MAASNVVDETVEKLMNEILVKVIKYQTANINM